MEPYEKGKTHIRRVSRSTGDQNRIVSKRMSPVHPNNNMALKKIPERMKEIPREYLGHFICCLGSNELSAFASGLIKRTFTSYYEILKEHVDACEYCSDLVSRIRESQEHDGIELVIIYRDKNTKETIRKL